MIYYLAEFFPFWSIPLAFVLLEMTLRFRRNRKTKLMLITTLLSLIVIGINVLYFMNDGRLTLRPAIMNVEKTYLK